MDKTLLARFLAVYPSKNREEPDLATLEYGDRNERIGAAVDEIEKNLPLTVGGAQWHFSATYRDVLRLTLDDNPTTGIVISLSVVADFYVLGSITEGGLREPQSSEQPFFEAALKWLHRFGFAHASTEFLCIAVPDFWACGGHQIAPDDPRNEDPDFEPPFIQATVLDCLFGSSF